MVSTNTKIYKVAGLSLLGFCAVSLGVDKANVGPVVSQLAGFGGAFLGALVAQRHLRSVKKERPGLFANRGVKPEPHHRQKSEGPELEPETVEQHAAEYADSEPAQKQY